MKKRLLSMLLVLVMTLSLAPTMAFAATTTQTGYTSSTAYRATMDKTYTKTWTESNYNKNCYIRFEVPSRGVVTFKIKKPIDSDGNLASFDLRLYDSSKAEIWACDTYDKKDDAYNYYTYKIGLAAGTYYMNVSPAIWGLDSENVSTTYSFNFTASTSHEVESNNTMSTATTLTKNKMYSGTYGEEAYDSATDYCDYFKVYLNKGTTYKIKIGNYNALEKTTWLMDIKAPDGQWQDITWEFQNQTSGDYNYYQFKAEKTGYYYIKFWNNGNGSGVNYKIGVTYFAAPSPTISNSTSSGKPMLKWSAVSGAAKYEIWRATSKSGTYSKVYTTTGTSYTNSSAKAGYTYYYKVRALTSGGTKSAFSSAKSITCDCARPVVSITTSSGHPKLSWSAVDGATSYVVYRATSSSGSYSKLGSTTKLSYINASATAGKTYYYKVKAVSSRSSYADSAYSAVKSIKAR